MKIITYKQEIFSHKHLTAYIKPELSDFSRKDRMRSEGIRFLFNLLKVDRILHPKFQHLNLFGVKCHL